ncbi:MAG: PAS domain S-box protein, partial [candidate division Zixibacteria bacterium]|nr:PAS domain S-box protein [candidate division Zixibacteria bacterium]
MENRTKTADNITLLLLPRFITFIFLFGGSIYLVKSNRFLWELLALYGAAAIAYLSLLLLRKNTAKAALRRILISHIILEVVISGLMVFHSGGHRSPLILLFILSIASASMVYQMRGAMFVSLSASISYLISIYFFLENLYSSDSAYSFTGILSHNSDIYFPVSLHIVLFTLVGLIAGYVSERLRERGVLLQTTEEELKRARRFTSDILESMGSGLICIDYSCEIILINRTAREILGINTPRSNETTVRDYLHNGYEPLAVFLETAAVENRDFDQYEVVVTRDDGIRVPLAVSTSLLSTPDEKPVGIIAVFQDLTEAKKLQQKLRIYDRLAAVGQLSAGIAHEIRNPLTSISGSVEVLQNELDLNPTNRKLMEVVIKESQRLNRILTEFLDYARIKPTMFTKIELNKLTDEVVEFISNDKRFESGIEIFNTLPAGIAAVGDEEKIRQVFINLILNAIDAVDTAEGRITIGRG